VGEVMFEQPISAIEGQAPESAIALDMVKKGAIVGPVLIVVFGLIWGLDGALSTAYGLAIVLANFALAAAMLSFAARISPAMMMFAALFGYLIRLALILAAIWLVKDASWVDLLPMGITIIVTHLGLLMWEMRYVSASLAYPGLKPSTSPVTKESSSQ
jgi:hypothetical protein